MNIGGNIILGKYLREHGRHDNPMCARNWWNSFILQIQVFIIRQIFLYPPVRHFPTSQTNIAVTFSGISRVTVGGFSVGVFKLVGSGSAAANSSGQLLLFVQLDSEICNVRFVSSFRWRWKGTFSATIVRIFGNLNIFFYCRIVPTLLAESKYCIMKRAE